MPKYLDALDRRMELSIHQRRFHERYDLLLPPVLSAPASCSTVQGTVEQSTPGDSAAKERLNFLYALDA